MLLPGQLLKARLRLATAGFKLRKFKTNSHKLQTHIQQNKLTIEREEDQLADIRVNKDDGAAMSFTPNEEPNTEGIHYYHVHAEDQSYAKMVLGTNSAKDSSKLHKVLRVH